MWTISLSNQKTFNAEQGSTLLDEAKSAGLALEHSCRTGRCGVCKAKVAQGATEILKVETALSPQECNDGYILTCCRGALGNMVLDIEDMGPLGAIRVKTLPCRIDSLHRLADDVLQVFLRLPPNNGFACVPGQYIDVIAKGGARRSYSIANVPCPDGQLELHIRQVPSGVMSQYWFTEAKPNDLLRLTGPLGTFSMRPTVNRHMVFLATGTGIAPVKAILEYMVQHPDKASGKQIHVYWGGRTPQDIYANPVPDSLEVKFVPVVSRPTASWKGRTGHVQKALIDDAIPLAQTSVYACGSDTMIHDARAQLIALGLQPKHFYADAFVSSN
jgi:CDP-4-dehydro-6-deoxyglucose reductase